MANILKNSIFQQFISVKLSSREHYGRKWILLCKCNDSYHDYLCIHPVTEEEQCHITHLTKHN